MRGILPLFILLIMALPLFGQVNISGQVIEKGSGEALPFATVKIKDTSTGVVTNVDGYFSLLNVSSEEFVLEVSFVGYNTIEVNINESNNNLIIELDPLGKQLDEVVVTANAYKVFDASSGTSVTTLSTKQIAKMPIIGEPDIFRSLQMLPGVSSTSENSSGLFIRGGTPDQNLTLLDGMTVYKVDHFFGFFSAFNSNAVKDVRLFRGAFPARYGGRMSGVVELTGKTGSFEKIQGGANLSLLSAGGYYEMPFSKKVSIFVAARRSYSEVIKGGLYKDLIGGLTKEETLDNTRLEDANVVSTEPDFYFYDWNTKLSYKPSNKDMITISTYSGNDYLKESQNIADFITDNIYVSYDLKEKTDWGNRGASAKWSRQWSPRVYTSIIAAGSEYFSDYSRYERLRIEQNDSLVFDRDRSTVEDNNVKDLSARADLEWQISLKSKAQFGLSITDNQIDYNNVRDDSVVLLTRNQQTTYGSAYASVENKIGDKLILNTGLRGTYYEFSDDPLLEPRIDASYQLTNRLKLKAGYGIHYQFTNQIVNQNISEGSREFWLLADEELIEIGSAEHFIGGASYKWDKWLIDVESYYKNLSGITEFSLQFKRGINEEVQELFRSGDGMAKGIEFLVQKTQGMYTGWVSYTLSDIQNTFPELNDGFAYRPLHYQRHEFKTVHSIEIDQWTLSANFIYGSGKPFSEPANQYQIELLDGRTLDYVGLGPRNASYNPDYIRLDLSANYDFNIGKTDARLGLSLFNLLNRKNVWYTEYDFGQSPPLINQITYLGFTPNLLFSINF